MLPQKASRSNRRRVRPAIKLPPTACKHERLRTHPRPHADIHTTLVRARTTRAPSITASNCSHDIMKVRPLTPAQRQGAFAFSRVDARMSDCARRETRPIFRARGYLCRSPNALSINNQTPLPIRFASHGAHRFDAARSACSAVQLAVELGGPYSALADGFSCASFPLFSRFKPVIRAA